MLIVHRFDGTMSYDGRKPATIDFSGDSTNIVSHITWSSWGSTASGQGTLMENTCQPNCAQGTLTPVATTIKLSGVQDGHYTSMTENSGGKVETYRYPSYWASGAS